MAVDHAHHDSQSLYQACVYERASCRQACDHSCGRSLRMLARGHQPSLGRCRATSVHDATRFPITALPSPRAPRPQHAQLARVRSHSHNQAASGAPCAADHALISSPAYLAPRHRLAVAAPLPLRARRYDGRMAEGGCEPESVPATARTDAHTHTQTHIYIQMSIKRTNAPRLLRQRVTIHALWHGL